MFHGQPHYDHILYLTDDGLKFGQLKLVFTMAINGETLPLCLISPLVQQPFTEKDKDMEFVCLYFQTETEIIPAHSIIWGAVLLHSYEH
jgi:hypothetical protein